jgi:hypothetical protein
MNLQLIAILLWSSRAVPNNPGSTYLDIIQRWKEQILAAHCLSLVTEGCVIRAKTEPSFGDKNGGGAFCGERIDEVLSNSSENWSRNGLKSVTKIPFCSLVACKLLKLVVPRVGVEPTRPYGQRILSP